MRSKDVTGGRVAATTFCQVWNSKDEEVERSLDDENSQEEDDPV